MRPLFFFTTFSVVQRQRAAPRAERGGPPCVPESRGSAGAQRQTFVGPLAEWPPASLRHRQPAPLSWPFAASLSAGTTGAEE